MAWLTANWFWVVIFIAFIAMHLFGHSGHSSHGGSDRQRSRDERDGDETPARTVTTGSSGHQH